MNRDDAVAKLQELENVSLMEKAIEFGVTVEGPSGRVNKGWAGHVCEKFLGLTSNSFQAPDFGDWELKVVPIKQLISGVWTYKETMAITMINPTEVANCSFAESHLLSKLNRFVLVVRTVGDTYSAPSYVHKVKAIDLEGQLLDAVERDYLEVQKCLRDPKRGFSALTGSMGTYIQPRTKGAGHGSTSRAFYARPLFLEAVVPIKM